MPLGARLLCHMLAVRQKPEELPQRALGGRGGLSLVS